MFYILEKCAGTAADDNGCARSFNLFLDNLSPEDLERELGVTVKPLEGDGALFVAALCGYEI